MRAPGRTRLQLQLLLSLLLLLLPSPPPPLLARGNPRGSLTRHPGCWGHLGGCGAGHGGSRVRWAH